MLAALILVIVAFVAYAYATRKSVIPAIKGEATAAAKAASAEAKLIELKATAEAHKVEALAVHDTLDEVHNLIG